MKAALATKPKAAIARPLKVLVPLIQDEIAYGDRAGLEHYRAAGEYLLEARDQVAPFKWGKWLSKNFDLSRSTAGRYMLLAERLKADPTLARSARQVTMKQIIEPNTYEQREARQAQWRLLIDAAKSVDADVFAEARQSRDDEMILHRNLALELVDIGYKALATRLHPDRVDGSKDAMRRLNRVRDTLKHVAQTRRFD